MKFASLLIFTITMVVMMATTSRLVSATDSCGCEGMYSKCIAYCDHACGDDQNCKVDGCYPQCSDQWYSCYALSGCGPTPASGPPPPSSSTMKQEPNVVKPQLKHRTHKKVVSIATPMVINVDEVETTTENELNSMNADPCGCVNAFNSCSAYCTKACGADPACFQSCVSDCSLEDAQCFALPNCGPPPSKQTVVPIAAEVKKPVTVNFVVPNADPCGCQDMFNRCSAYCTKACGNDTNCLQSCVSDCSLEEAQCFALPNCGPAPPPSKQPAPIIAKEEKSAAVVNSVVPNADPCGCQDMFNRCSAYCTKACGTDTSCLQPCVSDCSLEEAQCFALPNCGPGPVPNTIKTNSVAHRLHQAIPITQTKVLHE